MDQIWKAGGAIGIGGGAADLPKYSDPSPSLPSLHYTQLLSVLSSINVAGKSGSFVVEGRGKEEMKENYRFLEKTVPRFQRGLFF